MRSFHRGNQCLLLILLSVAVGADNKRQVRVQEEPEPDPVVRTLGQEFQDAVVQRLDKSLVMNRNSRQSQRETQQLLPVACLLLNEILPGNLQCTCTLTTALKFGCKGFEELCLSDAGYCSTPTVSGQLDLLTLSVTFKFCGFNATNNGRPIPGICINVGGKLVPPGFPIPNAKGDIKPPIRGANQTSSSAVTTGTTLPSLSSKMTSALGTCSATNIYGKECKSCNICNQGQGYTFDCSNIGRHVVQSSCTPLSIVSNLRLDQNITFLPMLDNPVGPVVAAPVQPPTAAPHTKTPTITNPTKNPTKAPPTKAPKAATKAPVKIPTSAPKAPTSGWGGLFAGWPGATTTIVVP
jgi:hypothetical protein